MNPKLLYLSGALSLFLLTGCHKIIDRVFHGGHEKTDCRIVKITQPEFDNSGDRTGLVYYNDQGDPDSVIFDINTGSAGATFFYFIYDEHHRLIEYHEDYSREEGDYYFKHKYIYANGSITIDSTFIRQAGAATEVRTLHYDDKKRVVAEDRVLVEADGEPKNEVLEPFEYVYNDAGNLFGYDYDDKINFLRTNWIWMFTQRNFSKNNPAVATGYNDHNLPLRFQNTGPYFLMISPLFVLEYECE